MKAFTRKSSVDWRVSQRMDYVIDLGLVEALFCPPEYGVTGGCVSTPHDLESAGGISDRILGSRPYVRKHETDGYCGCCLSISMAHP